MAKLANVPAILVVAAFAAIFHSIEAEDFTVGGNTGWTNNPSGGASFYSSWAADLTFNVNDVLVFDFATQRHDVAILTQANFDSCNVNDPIDLIATGPARVTLNRTGEFYFACTFSGHCNSGQKLSINVTDSSSSPSPPVAGSPGSSPPSTPGGESPPPSSATSLAIAFSLLLATICLNLLLHF
ncbi:umecyanin-like [Prosopis cineraria]|uniref:umecyanin-like n=1 Tax=Prosopis cineraria TaxID=364024 RepID=UPI00240FB178|nr:umecyanin-like [Prosopis cineraria]